MMIHVLLELRTVILVYVCEFCVHVQIFEDSKFCMSTVICVS